MYMMHPYYYQSVFPFGGLFWFLIILGVIFLVWAIAARHDHRSEDTDSEETLDEYESALEILKRRYARGEITKREFFAMKKDIS